ncbi:Internalin A [Fimbriiglobus ruber]|uniref:Leucine-rich repeat and WD repeat-containing protein 1 n=1 Tax=Fimbriiglobus ruber TaxID=1908690 RepID=A0A225DVG8_9BACT|nr:Internalin A [Fimbriiglobus ruber]
MVVTLPGAQEIANAVPVAGSEIAPLPRPDVSPELEFRFKDGDACIDAVVALSDNKTVITGHRDRKIRVWDINAHKLTNVCDMPGEVYALALHPNQTTLAINCTRFTGYENNPVDAPDEVLFLWDIPTAKEIRRFRGQRCRSSSLAFAMQGDLLITPDHDSGKIIAWQTKLGSFRILPPILTVTACAAVAVAPDGESVVATSMFNYLQFFKLPGGNQLHIERNINQAATPVFASSGRLLAHETEWGMIWIYDLTSGKRRLLSCPSARYASGLAFSPDNRLLVYSGDNTNRMSIWDVSGKSIPISTWIPSTSELVTRLAVTPDGRHLIATHTQGAVSVFRMPIDIPKWKAPPPPDQAWLDRVHKLPAEEQVKEVTADLKRRNPEFNETLSVSQHGDGRVSGCGIETGQLEDLTSLRGFPALTALTIKAKEGRGRIWDISPLSGMMLTYLDLRSNFIYDLSPLTGMPLQTFLIDHNPVTDLSPLSGMRLESFGACCTPISDLTPLGGAPLRSTWLHGTHVKDLAPLRHAPLQSITFNALQDSDLSPLANMPLVDCELFIHGNQPGTPEQLKALRGIKTLKAIDGKPAEEFWKTIDAAPPKK